MAIVKKHKLWLADTDASKNNQFVLSILKVQAECMKQRPSRLHTDQKSVKEHFPMTKRKRPVFAIFVHSLQILNYNLPTELVSK